MTLIRNPKIVWAPCQHSNYCPTIHAFAAPSDDCHFYGDFMSFLRKPNVH